MRATFPLSRSGGRSGTTPKTFGDGSRHRNAQGQLDMRRGLRYSEGMDMSFRQIIRQATGRYGWSAYRLAKEAGVPIRTVQAYFAEDIDLVGARLQKLCKALGLALGPVRRQKGR